MTHVQDYYFYRREEDVTFLSLSCFTCTFFMIEYVFANTLLLLVFVRIFGSINNHATMDTLRFFDNGDFWFGGKFKLVKKFELCVVPF